MKKKSSNFNNITGYFIGIIFSALLNSTLSYADVLNTQTPISPTVMVNSMGSGIDVTWSEVPNKIEEYSTKATVDFADKGFKHFRLRVANDDVATITAFLDQQIQDALDNGVISIIANQSHSFEDNPTPETQAAWVKWWGDIAEHYKDYPYEVMFDLIIEIASRSPLSDEPVDQLNEAYEQAVTAIRATGGNNTKRIIIFSAHKRSDPTKLDLLDIPTQGNGYLIGEFHEGYASGPSTDPENPHYYWQGTAAEIKLMSDRADAAIAWSEQTGIPVWEGAWMPGNYNKGDDYDLARQIRFVKDFVKVLNDRKIPHAVNATKKFYDVATNEWNELEEVVDAIIALNIDLNEEGANQPPAWSNTMYTLPDGEQEQSYHYDISADVLDPDNDVITFIKTSGAVWLQISNQGVLTGTPNSADVGLNSFLVEVSDEEGLTDSATIEINVKAKAATPVTPPEISTPTEAESPSGGNLSGVLLFLLFSSLLRKLVLSKEQ